MRFSNIAIKRIWSTYRSLTKYFICAITRQHSKRIDINNTNLHFWNTTSISNCMQYLDKLSEGDAEYEPIAIVPIIVPVISTVKRETFHHQISNWYLNRQSIPREDARADRGATPSANEPTRITPLIRSIKFKFISIQIWNFRLVYHRTTFEFLITRT